MAANPVASLMQGREKLHLVISNPVPIYEVFDRWIRKFEKPRLRALGNFKKQLERGRT